MILHLFSVSTGIYLGLPLENVKKKKDYYSNAYSFKVQNLIIFFFPKSKI